MAQGLEGEELQRGIESQNFIREQLALAANQDIAKINKDARLKAFQDDLDILQAQRLTLLAGTDEYLANGLAIEENAYKQKLENAEDNAKKIQAIETEHEANVKNIKLQAYISEKELAKDRVAVIGGIGNSLSQLAGKNKEVAIAGIVITKAAGIAEIILNTQIANAKALATLGPIAGPIWVGVNYVAAGLSIAAAVKSAADGIAQINAVKTPDSTAGSGGGGGGATPAFSVPTIGAPQIGPTSAQTGTIAGIAAGTMAGNNSIDRPLKAYVVGNDITTEQQLQRRIRTAARLGG